MLRPVLLSLVLLGCAGARPTVASADHPVLVEVQTYRVRRNTLDVVVNGVRAKFLLDTAAALTHVSPELAQQAGCKPWGQLVGYHMTGPKIASQRCDNVKVEVAGVKLDAPVVGVMDVMAGLPPDAERYDGILALDVFAGRQLTFDLGHHRFWIETPASFAERTRDMRENKARLTRELQGAALTVNVAADAPDGPVWFELDSGNGGTLLIAKPYAKYFGVDPEKDGPQQGTFTLASGAQVEGLVFVKELGLDGNVGMPFLALQVVAMDLGAGRVWLEPSGAPPPPPLLPPPPAH